jgi:hypothetical protein
MPALETLTRINLDDLVSSFGWENHPRLARLLRFLFRSQARRFARQMLDFDAAVGAYGLCEASRLTLRSFVRDVRFFSETSTDSEGCSRPVSSLKEAGPLLVLSNHPGMTDTLVLFAALNRSDLKIIALDRPFLKSLPNVSKRLYFVTDEPAARMALVRQVSGHLRSGGAALTFPAGQIEPDPDVYPGAVQSLEAWTDSVGVFVRLVPETVILPVLVRGVIWERTARHVAAALQLLAHLMLGVRPVSVRVQVGRPITATALGSKETQVVHRAVLAEMERLIENPPQAEGQSVL